MIERVATVRMMTWDVLGARVAPDGLGGQVFEGGLYLYPAELKEPIVRHFRRLHRRHHRQFPFDDLTTFFRKQGMVFHQLWLNLVAFPEPPQLLTTDGDPLVFCRSVFETDHAEAVRAELTAQPDIRATRDGHLSWREQSAGGDRELGSWSIEGNRIVFESTSQERAARGRAWLESLLGERVRYRATSLETLEQTMSELRSRGPRPAPFVAEDLPTEAAGAVRELFDRQYRAWLDRPVPALGNRTPRAAAGTRLWRAKVVDMLKQLENAAERASTTGRPAYDFRWLWQELGFERPRPGPAPPCLPRFHPCDKLTAVSEYLTGLLRRPPVGWWDLLDIAIVSIIFYEFLKLIRGTRAVQMAAGSLLLVGLFYISRLAPLQTLNWMIRNMLVYVAFAAIVIFQSDIRRALAHFGQAPFFRYFNRQEAANETIEELVVAATMLSSQRIGAIIAIEREIGLRNYIESGIPLDATLTYDLIVTIFQPKSPLHDGAVILQEDRIAAAACFLPLTVNPRVSRELGTRHRAAIGLTEENDAVAIVVSEERGQIALAINGRIDRGLSPDELRERLKTFVVQRRGSGVPSSAYDA